MWYSFGPVRPGTPNLRFLLEPPVLVPHRRTLLTLPGTHKLHSLREELNLLACHLCGERIKTEAFLNTLPILSCSPGDNPHGNSMTSTSRNGSFFCSERKIDPIQPPVGTAVDFLAMLYEKRFSYSSINTARCALSAILDPYGASRTTFGEHQDVKRFMKGIQYSVSTPFTSLQ